MKKYIACQSLYDQFVQRWKRPELRTMHCGRCSTGCNLALSWLGAKYVLHGAITTGQLDAPFGYIINILMALMMLSMAFVMISMLAVYGYRGSAGRDHRTAPAAVQVADGSIQATMSPSR